MKKCSRCGTEIATGQRVCPHCGKPQRQPRQVRCRHCGAIGKQSLQVCPKCGEPLRHDWLRPMLLGGMVLLGVAMGLFAGLWMQRGLARFRPAVVVGTVQAVVSEMPQLVEAPTLTPSMTPSPTPTPTNTSTPTPTPSLTPTPTFTSTPTPTRTPTPTDTPSPTATQFKPTRTPTATPTPAPTAVPPSLSKPEDEAPFQGENAVIKLDWNSTHMLAPDECYLVALRWTEGGAPAQNEVCVQDTQWFVPEALHLRADQETERVYFWSVRIAREEENEDGEVTYLPLSPSSEEWSFYWK